MPLLDVNAALVRAAVTWEDLHWIRNLWPGPIVIKGVLTGDDARRAVDAGAAAVVVSNHGGRQLDGVPASLRVLPEVVTAVNGQAEVLMDGGIRRGADIAKALCLGARAVLCGRAYAYGLAAAGQAGVARALEILRTDFQQLSGMTEPLQVISNDAEWQWSEKDLTGCSAQEQQEIVLVLPERIPVHVDPVVDDAGVVELRHRAALRLADGDEPRLVGDLVVKHPHLVVERAVDGVHDGMPAEDGGDERRPRRVHVEEVESMRVPEHLQRVHDVVPRRVDVTRPGSLLEEELQLRLRLGVAGGEQRDVVSSIDETVGEESNHPLDPAVTGGGNGEPRRCDLCDAHAHETSGLGESGC